MTTYLYSDKVIIIVVFYIFEQKKRIKTNVLSLQIDKACLFTAEMYYQNKISWVSQHWIWQMVIYIIWDMRKQTITWTNDGWDYWLLM